MISRSIVCAWILVDGFSKRSEKTSDVMDLFKYILELLNECSNIYL